MASFGSVAETAQLRLRMATIVFSFPKRRHSQIDTNADNPDATQNLRLPCRISPIQFGAFKSERQTWVRAAELLFVVTASHRFL